MVDLDTRMKIEEILDYSYNTTIERMNAIEEAPSNSNYQTIAATKDDFNSYIQAYMNYYCGTLEGILFTLFLDKFNRLPNPSENAFIVEAIGTKWEKLKDIVIELSKKKFKEDSKITETTK